MRCLMDHISSMGESNGPSPRRSAAAGGRPISMMDVTGGCISASRRFERLSLVLQPGLAGRRAERYGSR